MKLLLSVFFFFYMPVPAGAQADAEHAEHRSVLFDLYRVRNSRVLPAAFPIDSRLTPARPFAAEGYTALRLSTHFDKHDMGRAAWDIVVNLDLRLSDGLQFKFRCADASSVSYFTFYLQSGEGWYAVDFAPTANRQWETIVIEPARTRVEGTPSGWARISRIRIAAWRANAGNAEFDIAAFEARPVDPSIVVVRGVNDGYQDAPAGEKTTILGQAQRIVDLLHAYRLRVVFMDELDVSREVLRRTHTVILPYSPLMSLRTAEMLAEYQRGGGVILGFYTIHPALQATTGIQKDGYVTSAQVPGGFGAVVATAGGSRYLPPVVHQQSWNVNRLVPPPAGAVLADWHTRDSGSTGIPAIVTGQRSVWMSHVLLNTRPEAGGRLLLGMISVFSPEVLRQAALGSLRNIGNWSGKSLHETFMQLERAETADPLAQRALKTALQRREQAIAHLTQGQYLSSVAEADAAGRFLEEAYFRTRRPAVPEFRGVWCHSPRGIKGWDWERSMRHLRNSGFNAIFPNFLNGWSAWYPSGVLENAGAGKHDDPLEEALAAARRNGIKCHVWMTLFRINGSVNDETIRRIAAAGHFQEDSRGRTIERWLCPNDPANQKRIFKAVAELAGKYPIDGLHLDYVRYAGSNACFCNDCRARFEQYLGRRLSGWPRPVLADGELYRRWLSFRAQVITEYVRSLGNLLRQKRPHAQLSAAVFTDPESAANSIGQPWDEWAKNGDVHFLCPMDYESETRSFARLVLQQKRAVADAGVPLYPGIGVSSEGLDAVDVVQQIEAARHLGVGGFMLFQYRLDEATNILPALAKGLTGPVKRRDETE